MEAVSISNGRGRLLIVEPSEDGVEVTLEHEESGQSEGIVLDEVQTLDFVAALMKAFAENFTARRLKSV